MLKVYNLTKSLGNTKAINNLSFSVNPGEIVGLLGPNGAGKTTTIRCIVSLLLPDLGQITINGHDIVTQTIRAKQALAYVPEIPVAYEMLTVLEHLCFVTASFNEHDMMAQAESVLKRVGLWEKRDALGSSLSKGMTQKLACACALIHRARLFCFDEPLIGLDPKGAKELKEIMRQLRDDDAAILVSTHQLEYAERFCDRLIIMHEGTLVSEGTFEQLQELARSKNRASLEDIFLTLTERNQA